MTGNLSASILARLLTLAKKRGDDYNLLLNRFGMERLLARVSTSPHADRFLLKGALLFALWYDTPHRPTRDADLLGFGPDDEANLIATFRDIVAMHLGDGIVFDPDSVKADAIREDNTYGGTRITLVARIGSARCALQIDVGFGDAVTPGPQTVAYPTLLGDFPAPTLRVYPVYTVIAEKYQAMVMLGQPSDSMASPDISPVSISGAARTSSKPIAESPSWATCMVSCACSANADKSAGFEAL